MKSKLFILLFFTSLALFSSCDDGSKTAESRNQESPSTSETVSGYTIAGIDSLHTKRTVKNRDRSFEEYRDSAPNRPDSVQSKIYLLPVGNMRPNVEEIIRSETDYLSRFFQLPVEVLPRVDFATITQLPSIKTRMVSRNDYDHYSKMKGEISQLQEQIQASSFMDEFLKTRIPKDAITVLAITEHDIYNPKYNYLFGSSRLKDRMGIISTFRLIDYGETTVHNIRKLVSKQITNTLSIKNVKDYNCLLNFHSSKRKLEQGLFQLSPLALEKLSWNIQFDLENRFNELLSFWQKENNEKMSEYYQACLNLTTRK